MPLPLTMPSTLDLTSRLETGCWKIAPEARVGTAILGVGREGVHRRPEMWTVPSRSGFKVIGDTVERINHRCCTRAVDAVQVSGGISADDRNIERVDAFVAARKVAGVGADVRDDLRGQGGGRYWERSAGGHRIGVGRCVTDTGDRKCQRDIGGLLRSQQSDCPEVSLKVASNIATFVIEREGAGQRKDGASSSRL